MAGVFALVVVSNGAYLASELAATGMRLPGTSTLILLVLAVMTVLTVQGFGFLLPNEVLVYRELLTASPDAERIGRLGMRNAKLSGVQGAFQLAIVVLMVWLRWGGF